MNHSELALYLKKIGLSINSCSVDEETLQKIYFAHVTHIPYQNLDIYIECKKPSWQRKPIDISYENVFKQVVVEGNGGYCYATAELLYYALDAVGFHVKRTRGYPLFGEPLKAYQPTHSLVIVELNDDKWLLDPAMGTVSPRFPIKLKVDEKGTRIINQDFEQLRLISEEVMGRAGYSLGRLFGENWIKLHCFNLNYSDRASIEWNNTAYAYYPDIKGSYHEYLIVSLIAAKGRKRIICTDQKSVYEHHTENGVEERKINNGNELVSILKEEFSIDAPENLSAVFEMPRYKPKRRLSLFDDQPKFNKEVYTTLPESVYRI